MLTRTREELINEFMKMDDREKLLNFSIYSGNDPDFERLSREDQRLLREEYEIVRNYRELLWRRISELGIAYDLVKQAAKRINDGESFREVCLDLGSKGDDKTVRVLFTRDSTGKLHIIDQQ